ncbi:uncharacterized protein [Medicago truncatula]|uniref:uncharacterized protein n=1 Tax=Medicago truncatula TaxID=3880 RepID=UPI000D2F32A4|nr:uncharacterized protein LOC112418659 [Medicago truncatula]
MRDWRPISLCNVLYKLISKVLANRLQVVLPKCIFDSQLAFVSGRSILDNALVAIEVINSMNTNTRIVDGSVALKLDISKAYDRIDWDYLKGVMVRMGFNSQRVQWMTICVETVDYSVLVNNELIGPIIPGRGLRQGDPLSPYLFIICAEGLSSLIRRAEARGDLRGTSVCRGAPPVTHLLFADDCFLFFKTTENQAQVMQSILTTYEAAFGQSISLPKSETFYSRKVPENMKYSITNIMGVRAVLGTGKYLGLPSMIGRNHTAVFSYVKDRVWQKINTWSSKCLSKAGREVMIKSVLQAIPSYIMIIFMLSSNIIFTIEKMMNAFWWGHGGSNNRGIHWLSWEKLSMHKTNGGMGFKDLTAFNLAMLGSSIPIIDEPWLRNGTKLASNIANVHLLRNFGVDSLIHTHSKTWNVEVIHQVFDDASAASILQTSLFEQVTDDALIWKAERNGLYSVKSAYRLCVEELIDTAHLRRDEYWSGIWRLKVPQKIKNLIWRMCRGFFPTRDLSRDESQRFAALLWSTWKHRNLKLWQGVSKTVAQAVDMAIHLVEDWSMANMPAAAVQSSNNIPAVAISSSGMSAEANGSRPLRAAANNNNNNSGMNSRNRPNQGRFKCNIDVAFSNELNITGLGMCIRDEGGVFVLAKAIPLQVIHSVHVGEVLGLYYALEWLSDMRFDNVDFALDSKTTVDAFNKSRPDVYEFGLIISACRSLFDLHFTNSKVEFNRRQANEVAHTIAGVAILLASPITYSYVPRCIEHLIFNEML